MEFTIALDLEGTLITDAEERIPRRGLYSFLESCREVGRVVIYTMVGETSFREAARELVSGGHAPDWFPKIEHYHCGRGEYKDLNRIADTDADHAVLVDDISGFVAPGQIRRWIPVMFVDPAIPDDIEFDLAIWRIRRQYKKITGESVNTTFPADPTLAMADMQDQIDELTCDNFELQAENEKLTQALQEYEDDLVDVMRSRIQEVDAALKKTLEKMDQNLSEIRIRNGKKEPSGTR